MSGHSLWVRGGRWIYILGGSEYVNIFMGEWGWVEVGGGIFWVVGVGVHFYG